MNEMDHTNEDKLGYSHHPAPAGEMKTSQNTNKNTTIGFSQESQHHDPTNQL